MSADGAGQRAGEQPPGAEQGVKQATCTSFWMSLQVRMHPPALFPGECSLTLTHPCRAVPVTLPPLPPPPPAPRCCPARPCRDGVAALCWHPSLAPMQLLVVGAEGHIDVWAKVRGQGAWGRGGGGYAWKSVGGHGGAVQQCRAWRQRRGAGQRRVHAACVVVLSLLSALQLAPRRRLRLHQGPVVPSPSAVCCRRSQKTGLRLLQTSRSFTRTSAWRWRRGGRVGGGGGRGRLRRPRGAARHVRIQRPGGWGWTLPPRRGQMPSFVPLDCPPGQSHHLQ